MAMQPHDGQNGTNTDHIQPYNHNSYPSDNPIPPVVTNIPNAFWQGQPAHQFNQHLTPQNTTSRLTFQDMVDIAYTNTNIIHRTLNQGQPIRPLTVTNGIQGANTTHLTNSTAPISFTINHSAAPTNPFSSIEELSTTNNIMSAPNLAHNRCMSTTISPATVTPRAASLSQSLEPRDDFRPTEALSTTHVIPAVNANNPTQQATHAKTKPPKKTLYCPICNLKCHCKSRLNQHMGVHTKEKPFACVYCHKSFSQKSSLNRHERIHTGEKPYACTFCHKSFIQKSDLTRHARLHTGEKPFSCAYCHKKFAQQSNLKEHERIHTGEKPFACTFCHKKFANRCNLKEHERIHTGEKPFACTFCHKRFTQHSTWKKHKKTQHNAQ